jgi:hypothetical protein
LDKLKNKRHHSIGKRLNAIAQLADNSLRTIMRWISIKYAQSYDEDAAKVALQLVPVIAVIDTNNLIL